jgi:TrmH family RNA methyltransferase
MITSLQNPNVQRVRLLLGRAKRRREEQAFVVEGVRLVEEALLSGWGARLVLFTRGSGDRVERLVVSFLEQGAQVEEVAPQVMRVLSDTEHPQGILGVLPIRRLQIPEKLHFALALDELRDPGNLGTILRTAAAAGVQTVFLSSGTVDPFSPKVVRAGMGAHFWLPLKELSWPEIQGEIERSGLRLLAASAGEGTVYTEADLRGPLALVIGGEAGGAGLAARSLADQFLHIPMLGGGESLDAAAAAAILLFEVVRQRGLPA